MLLRHEVRTLVNGGRDVADSAGHPIQVLCVAKEQHAIRTKVIEQRIHRLLLRLRVKVDQHIAAEDRVEILRQPGWKLVEIQPLQLNDILHGRNDF
jgi:hypothetical protein